MAVRFRMDHGAITFGSLCFQVVNSKVDMGGTLQMKAELSETQSGMKAWLLKPLGPLFRENGAGFEVPVSVTGTREHPVIAVSVFHHQFDIH
jgi:hypothetical protein